MPEPIQALEYCFVCSRLLTAVSGRVLLRPLKNSGERSAIPLEDRRVTACAEHSAALVASGDYAVVEAAPARIKG